LKDSEHDGGDNRSEKKYRDKARDAKETPREAERGYHQQTLRGAVIKDNEGDDGCGIPSTTFERSLRPAFVRNIPVPTRDRLS
jgi:hypothetical protein